MIEIEPGYYWARAPTYDWTVVEYRTSKRGNYLLLPGFEEEEGLEYWEFGPRLEPPQDGTGRPFYSHQCPKRANPAIPVRLSTGERVPLLVILEVGEACPWCGFVRPKEEK